MVMTRESLMPVWMCGRFLVVLTEVRPLAGNDSWRDERQRPERRYCTAFAETPAAAAMMASALASRPPVREGRRRVKVLALGRRERR